jgi:2-polyprenyl-3-methyl-5-hydroxy-6-metoxy-1,4-benzoquinol methylase
LDVGFGSGAFLENAAAARRAVAGIDIDDKVVANAKALGFTVRRGAIEAFADEPGSFDAITMSHVIEHVHDPIAVLHGVFRLLKPAGMLYLETPNIESLGHDTFGAKLARPRTSSTSGNFLPEFNSGTG